MQKDIQGLDAITKSIGINLECLFYIDPHSVIAEFLLLSLGRLLKYR